MNLAPARSAAAKVGNAVEAAAGNTYGTEVFRRVDDLPADVLALLEAQEPLIGMQSAPGWYRNLERTVFADHPGVRYFVLRGNGQPAAVLPTLAERTALGWQVRALTNYYTALYAPALAAATSAEALAVLLRAVASHHAPLRAMRLNPMDPAQRGFTTLEDAARHAGLWPYRFFCFGNWYLPRPPEWPAYLKARPGKVRSTITRMGAKFAAEGGRLEVITAPADVERGLAAYLHVYGRSWKKPEPYPEFTPGLIRLCAESGWLRLGVAWVGDVAVAAQLWIVTAQRAEIYKLAYDEAYRKLSPGTLLTQMLMRQVIEDGQVSEIDYLIGDDPYKREWMPDRRERHGLMVYNPRSLGGLADWSKHALGVRSRSLRERLQRWRDARSAAPTTPA